MTTPPSTPQPTDIRCIECGYDLSGTAVGGYCPECGTPVAHSLRPRLQPKAEDNTDANIALLCGILGPFCCFILPPIAWYLGHKVIKDAPLEGYSPGTMRRARIGMIFGIAGTVVWIVRYLGEQFHWW